MTATTDPITVADLRRLLDRHKKALCEAGRPDLAERASIFVDENDVSISFARRGQPGPASDVVRRALEIDPEFQLTDSAGPPA